MKRLLIISRIFAPCASIGGHRAIKLARGIGPHGWKPIVLTAPPRCQEPIDPDLGRDVLTNTPLVQVPCYTLSQHCQDLHNNSGPLRRRLLQAGRGLGKIVSAFIPGDTAVPWAIAARGPGIRAIRDWGVDLIWATCPQFSAARLAYQLSVATGVPYVIDFRDVPCPDETANVRAARLLQLERRIVAGAAAVCYVSPGQRDSLLARYPDLDEVRTRLIYNWFEAKDGNIKPSAFGRKTILHGGVLYAGHRKLGAFLQALARLRAESDFSQLQFLQHSIEQDLSYLVRDCEKYGVTQAVRIGQSLPREEFLRACRGADILLLAVGRDSAGLQHAGAIPGKLFDYLAVRRPVLVVGPLGCEAGKIVESIQCGLAVPDDSTDEIAGAIRLLFQKQGRRGPLKLDMASAGQFEAAGAMRAFASLFDDVLAGRCLRGGHRVSADTSHSVLEQE